jgi:DNA-binding NarL/FixJ family response regulator
VLQLLARELANKTIAAELVIFENTVKSHVRTDLDKLQKGSRREAAMYAVRETLVEVAGPSRT